MLEQNAQRDSPTGIQRSTIPSPVSSRGCKIEKVEVWEGEEGERKERQKDTDGETRAKLHLSFIGQ